MNFLAPLFLLGAAAVALPVLFHLIRRTPRDRLPFSSLLFLSPSPPRVTRRSRIEHWLLLLLRCAALALLAFGFARPFLRGANPAPPEGDPARRVVLLLDTSASMQRTGLWDEARNRAAAILRRLTPADQVAVFTFARELTPLLGFAEWNATAAGERSAVALSRLAEIRPGWSATHLGDALVGATEALGEREDDTFAGHREVIVLTDLQEGARLGSLQGFDWPANIRLLVETLRPPALGNAGLQLVADTVGAPLSTAAVVRVRVSNSADAQTERFKVGWAGPGGEPGPDAQDVYVPPGQSRIATLPAHAPGAVTEAGGRIVLRGDPHPFDNTVFVPPAEPAVLSVLFLGDDTGTNPRQPLYFLRRALPSTRQLDIRLAAFTPAQAPPAAAIADAGLVFVTDALPAATAEAVRQTLLDGRTIVFAPRTAGAAGTLGRLLDVPGIAAEEMEPPNYALLGEVDFRHPLLASFVDPRFSDFTRIHFWKYRRLDASALPGARVVARFDNGDPAWVEVPAGRGRLLLLAAGWHPDDSQLALSTKFVPFLFSILDWSGAAPPAAGQLVVDTPLPLPKGTAPAAANLRLPDGSVAAVAPGTGAFAGTRQPGLYEWSAGGMTRRFAVNLDPAESLTAPRPRDEFDALGIALTETATPTPRPAQAAPQLAAAETESRQKLWRWFLLATLLIALLETAIAGWTTRRIPLSQGAVP